jgi:hypothetical protein
MQKYLCPFLIAPLMVFTGCQQMSDQPGNNSGGPTPGAYGSFLPGEITPYPQVIVQIAKPTEATMLNILFNYNGKTFSRILSDLPPGETFASGTPATFFNSPELKMVVGQTFTVDANFANSERQVGSTIHLTGTVPAVKVQNAVLFVIRN